MAQAIYKIRKKLIGRVKRLIKIHQKIEIEKLLYCQVKSRKVVRAGKEKYKLLSLLRSKMITC